MNKKWFRLTLPNDLSVIEARTWCEENCNGRYRVRQPKTKYDGTSWTNLYRKASAVFQRDDDAVAFKLRWL